MQARNPTGERPADGVFLRLLDVTAPAGANFDSQRHLKLTWNGQNADDLWRSPSPTGAGRSIGPNQQAEIGGTLQGLTPGEYTMKLGVGAADVPVDSEQQVSLKLFVTHRVWLPLAVLLTAILISYFATKGLEAQRKRVSQLRKVDEIRPGWLREEPPTLPVVAARAILRQVEDRKRKWYDSLFGQDATSTLVAKAELLLRILARMRRIRSRIKGSDRDKMIRNRANKRLDSIAGSLNPYTVDENAVKQIETELEGLEKWFDPKQRSAFRFNELSALSIATLFAVISSLSIFYFGKPAFGAVGDYIALFLWGAGVDQTKTSSRTWSEPRAAADFSPQVLVPEFLQPFRGDRERRAQLLGEERNAQLLDEPAVLFQFRIAAPGVVVALRAPRGSAIALAPRRRASGRARRWRDTSSA